VLSNLTKGDQMSLHFRDGCKIKALKWLLPRLLSKKCGKVVRMSGEEEKKVNCYLISIANENGEFVHQVSGIDIAENKLYVQSLDCNTQTYSISETLNLEIIFSNKITVAHFYKRHPRTYNSLFSLFFNYMTKYTLIKVNLNILWNYFIQSRFNRKELLVHKGMDLLRFMLENQLDQSTDSPTCQTAGGISIFDLMTQLHSSRWLNHPNRNRKQCEIKLYLESLVDTGDLKTDTSGYHYLVTGKALQTIQQYEEEERRHNDSVKVQKGIFYLTFFIALAALIQAIKLFCPIGKM
jgi:hypothetical protein